MSGGQAGTREGDDRSTSSGRAVLLVEDNVGVAKWVRIALEDCGCRVLWATRIEQARNLLGQHDFDAAVLDVTLPDGNGMDLVAELRTRDHPCAAVVFTGNVGSTAARTAAGLGVAEFLKKPVPPDRLIRAVETAVQRTEALRAFCGPGGMPDAAVIRDSVEARLPDNEPVAQDRLTTAARLDQVAEEFCLSGRQRQAMAGVAHGSTDAEIAHDMEISYSRTRHLLGTMFKKLGLKSRNDFIRFVWDRAHDAKPEA